MLPATVAWFTQLLEGAVGEQQRKVQVLRQEHQGADDEEGRGVDAAQGAVSGAREAGRQAQAQVNRNKEAMNKLQQDVCGGVCGGVYGGAWMQTQCTYKHTPPPFP